MGESNGEEILRQKIGGSGGGTSANNAHTCTVKSKDFWCILQVLLFGLEVTAGRMAKIPWFFFYLFLPSFTIFFLS